MSVSYDSTAVGFTPLGISGNTIELKNTGTAAWTAISQSSPNQETIGALVKQYYSLNINQSGRNMTINLSGAGGLNLPSGLQWGINPTSATSTLIVTGPGPLTVGGAIRGDLSNTGGTGGTVKDVRLDGDATSGSTVTFNPTDASTWNAVGNMILNGRVTFNIGNAGAVDAGTIQFNSGANNASFLITGTTTSSTFARPMTFNSITGGVQTIGVNLPSPGSATITSNLALTPANLNPALFAGPGSNAMFTGSITGTRPVSITGTGIVTIANAASYSGAMTINAGATLAGAGTGGALTVNGTVSPGDNATGLLTTAAQFWNPGGSYKWEINDDAGVAGTAVGWDKIAFSTLNILATSASKFTIQIVGNPANFNSLLPHSWVIASGSTPGGITGFDPNAFVLDDSAFTHGTGGGTFAVQQSGDNLNVTFTPGTAPEPGTAALCIIAATALGLRPRR